MRKLSGLSAKLFLLIFTAAAAYITRFTFTEWDRAGFLYPLLSRAEQIAVIAAGVLLIAALCGIFLRFMASASEKKERFFTVLVFTILFAGQLLLICSIGQSTFMYDPYRVFDEALHMLSTHTVSGTVMEGYYGIYPNNIPFTLICYWILSIGSAFGLADTGLMVLLQILNALCMDLAVFLTFCILKNWCTGNAARLFLFLCLINPLVYLWPGFAYTSTFSMPFLMGALFLFLLLIHSDSKKSQIRCGALLGLVLILGFKIRATVMITLIAAAIWALLGFAGKLRALLPGFLALILSLAVSLSAFGAIQKHYVDFDYTDTAFPVVSWLAMGALEETDGMFNTQDYYDTRNAPTKEAKQTLNEQKLSRRLKDLGPSGILRLAGRKMVRTWADGTDDYVSYLNQYADTGKLHTFLLEDKKDFLVCYMQMMRCFLFLFTTIGSLLLLIRRKTPDRFLTEQEKPLLLLQLNLLGGTLFHVLWETGELYSLCFSFLLFALAAAGFDALYCRPSEARADTSLSVHRFGGPAAAVLVLIAAGTAGWLFCHTADFIHTPVKRHDSVISQKTYTSSEQSGLTAGNTLEQTFCTDKPFNRVCVRVKNVLPEGRDSEYFVTVTSENGEVLLSQTVTGNDVFDYDYFYFGLDTQARPEDLTEYTIRITCLKGDESNSIAFLRYDTGNHDAYLPGTLSENGVAVNKADLNFMIYCSYEDTYFRPGSWYFLCAVLLLGELLLAVCYALQNRREQKT